MARKSNTLPKLDRTDRRILQIVQRDGMLPQSAVAAKVGLSTAAVHERLKKLRAAGIIRRFVALVDATAVGATVTAFVEVFFEHPRFEPAFLERVVKLDEVLECHHITGEFSLLLKVRVRDMKALQHLLLRQLGGQQGVRQTRTVMVLSTAKEETYIDPGTEGDDR
ncbi:MAG: Lrp/AsnC family transcriptional regulator [Acidobacteria bacterium]|nr:Lrp/AsnC family transcriptional regulator [Acidobacteriota bacterium]